MKAGAVPLERSMGHGVGTYIQHGCRCWMGGGHWMNSGLLGPVTTRARGYLNEDASCFAQVTFSLPDSATCVFRSLARGSGWCQRRQRPAANWRGLWGVTQTWASWQSVTADVGFMTISYQQVPLPLALTLGVSQPIMPHLEGWHQGVGWRKSPPIK